VVFLFLLQDGRLFYSEAWANTLFRNLDKYPEKSVVPYEDHEIIIIIIIINHIYGARGGAVDGSIALQAGRSWVRFPMVT